MKKELELYTKGNYAKLEGDMLRAVGDAFESAWQEQQEKINAVLHAIAQSELYSDRDIWGLRDEIKELLK